MPWCGWYCVAGWTCAEGFNGCDVGVDLDSYDESSSVVAVVPSYLSAWVADDLVAFA